MLHITHWSVLGRLGVFFFFSSRRRHTRFDCDWSSDVCSSDLRGVDKGLVHVFVDASADPAMAVQIVLNAKAQRPSVCNALETLLVHREIAPRLLPSLAARLAAAGVEPRGCPLIRRLLPSGRPATDRD